LSLKIAIDAMSGDHGLTVTVPAALQALKTWSDVHLLLVGREDEVRAVLDQHSYDPQRVEVVHADQVVEMDELPSKALRQKRQSSMRVALNLVKDGKADACVSAGNTGALMAMSKFVLKMLPGIERPAICTAMPTMTGHVHMLDLGANVGVDGENLLQFALMGSVLVSQLDNNPSPSVGLLNIGEEEIKGPERIRHAHRLLLQTPLNYVGYVEGDDIYKGTINVVVCDGFDGNIALKASEGVAKMISFHMKKAFNRNWLTRLAGVVALPVLKNLRQTIDPRRYNGASLLGLRKIVVKSHGGADDFAFFHAIGQARLEVQKDIPTMISQQLEELMVTLEKQEVIHEPEQASV
jgi:glycerol-3-phosphate acyltransferase PlsX